MTKTAKANSAILTSVTFLRIPAFNIDFELRAKIFNQEGDLKYEYNPFRNIQLTTGELSDFRTDILNFNLNSPVDITVQPSYDGSVNLILNDDTNPPRLINSRFTVIEDKRYKIIDRVGNNDTNLYKQNFVAQTTRLFRTSEKIPKIAFQGLSEGGSNKCGNYVFYLKYVDADGNESDIIAESGIISCYVGKINDPFSIRGGVADELTNKIIKLKVYNLDKSYDYLNIYYTRSTGDTMKTEVTEAYKIMTKKTIKDGFVDITITGLEGAKQISVNDLNVQYNMVSSVKTQAQVQNMLFFGNVDKPTVPYEELKDLSLRVYPFLSNSVNIGYMDHEYNALELTDDLRKYEYYDAGNVYKYTGYWNKEIYRVGIVYVLNDDSLSPVYNIRGRNNVDALKTFTSDIQEKIETAYRHEPLLNGDGKRNYVQYDDQGYISNPTADLENSKGVIRLQSDLDLVNKGGNDGVYPLALDFIIETATLTEIKKYAKGFFFVRQKRIPTILAQGISIGVDDVSFIPTIKGKLRKSGQDLITNFTEAFLSKDRQLVHDFNSRLLVPDNPARIKVAGMLCPEAQLRHEYFNEVFTGSLFNISEATFSSTQGYFNQDPIDKTHFYIESYDNNLGNPFLKKNIKLTLVEDNVPLRYSGTRRFSTRAGTPEEAWKFNWYSTENRVAGATNLVRGAFTGFIGAEGIDEECMIYDIHVPGYDLSNMRDYFNLRGDSFHPFHAISDRYDLNVIADTSKPLIYDTVGLKTGYTSFTEYRGDCFIGNYTTRIIRNFQDPETPINDLIVDTLTWTNNYTGYTANGSLDKEKIAKINRSDVNAIKMGHWATFKLCSNINFAYRAIDDSFASELALTGKSRSFFPYAAMSVTGESKIPESSLVNVGYNSTTSDKLYISMPDVPYIKNIFDNRIMFSEIHINDAFRNGYRVFQGLDYKDITRQYGAIVKMFEWRGDLLVVFENGVAIVPINERAMVGDGTGGGIFIKGAGVLSENVVPLSTDFGSAWKESIIATQRYIYGVDTVGKKIWRTDGKQFEIISDFKVQKYLNDNITLDESEKTPMIALRNVKTHFNAFKQDVMFTFYDTTRDDEEIKWSLCFNEQLNEWITRYSWTPLASQSINNVYFSFDREAGKKIALLGYTLTSSDTAEGITLSSINITGLTARVVGDLSLKGYNYYKKYTHVYSLVSGELDNSLFSITKVGSVWKLNWLGVSAYTKYSYQLKVRVGLGTMAGDVFTELEHFHDFIAVKVDRTTLSSEAQEDFDEEFTTYFWKHGQAGIFDITTEIKPTEWYGNQEVFEYEFIVADKPNLHKIYDNLLIISNNAEPDSFEFEVVGDAYSMSRSTVNYPNTNSTYITYVDSKNVRTYQKGLDIKSQGRRLGNMHYKEDLWDVEIKPVRFTEGSNVKQARIRDKYCRIRVRYSGTKLAVITALQTIYTQSYS